MVQAELCCANADLAQDLVRLHGDLLHRLSSAWSIRVLYPGEAIEPRRDRRFRVEDAMALLSTQRLGRTLACFDTVESTQNVARDDLRELCPGLVVVAERQTSGRGRRGASWLSPEGSLAFSVVIGLPRERGVDLPFLQYVAALAIVDAARSREEWQAIPVRIKWPNDIVIGNSKVAGILCDAISVEGSFLVAVGFGINVSNPSPGTSLAASLADPAAVSLEAFLAATVNALEPLVQTFVSGGFDPLLERYYRAWLHGDQRIFLEGRGGQSARVVGLAADGAITVQVESTGERLDLDPHSTSLDLDTAIVRDKRA